MTILALDLGTTTGWASHKKDTQSGSIYFKPSRFEGGGMRYVKFKRWLNDLNNTLGGISEIYFEEIRRHLGVDAAHAYGGFLAHLTAWCEEMNIPYQGIGVGTIKKFATGKGNANKEQMIAAMQKRGYSPADDNEADALSLLLYVRERYGCRKT